MKRKYKQITTKEYRAWQAMKTRCNNKNVRQYRDYGGRGITVCKEFEDFNGFFNYVGLAPSPNHSLDRIDNNKGYEIGNVRWATSSEQAFNKRPFVHHIMYSENMDNIPSLFLSRSEAMKYLGFKIKWMQSALYRDLIPHIKVGKYTRYNLNILEKFKTDFFRIVGEYPSKDYMLTRIDKNKPVTLDNIEWKNMSQICMNRIFTHSCVDRVKDDVRSFPIDTCKNRSIRLGVSEAVIYYHLNGMFSYKKIDNLTDKLVNLFKIWPNDINEVTYDFLLSHGYRSGQINKYIRKGILIRISKGLYKIVKITEI